MTSTYSAASSLQQRPLCESLAEQIRLKVSDFSPSALTDIAEVSLAPNSPPPAMPTKVPQKGNSVLDL